MKDEWVATALSNDSIVVELLFRLKQSSCEPAKPLSLCLPLGWGHRQPRSKPLISAKKDSATTTTSTTRCSPTTPLSWSGGAASPSDGAYEDCSNSSLPSFDPSRSKDSSYCASEATATGKRSRKKTFAELKEEENILLKERVNLTKELASLHVTLKEQKARRENLKRIKFDLNLNSSSEPVVVVPNQINNNQMEASTSSDPAAPSEEFPRNVARAGHGSSSSTGVEKEVGTAPAQQRCFFLPDLNMMPSEEDISGIS